MRGGCQSVVKRTESCHALSFCMERRAVVLRRNVREGCFREVPFACRAASQPNNSRAWRADSFLTFLTASSTVLMGGQVSQEIGLEQARFAFIGQPTPEGEAAY